MLPIAKKAIIAGVGALGAAAGAAALALALIKPRTGDKQVDEQWEQFKRYRFAHRGLHDNAGPAPENSLEAFRLARLEGFGSELDVHLTADGEPVVVHDYNLSRATGEKLEVESLTLNELGRLRLFGTDEPIPRLEQVLEVYEGFGKGETPPLIVELKTTRGNYVELAKKTLAVLDAHTVPYCIESFDPRVIAWLRFNRPDVIRGQLSQDWVTRGGVEGGPVMGFVMTHLLSDAVARPDFIAYRYEDRDRRAVQLATKRLGGKLATWTIKTPEALYATEAAGGIPIFEGMVPKD